MSRISEVFDAFGSNMLGGMHTSFPAKVVKYYEDENTCDIQPIYKINETENYPQVNEVPIIKFRYKFKRPKLETELESAHTHNAPNGGGTTSGGSPHKHEIKISTEDTEEEIKLFLKTGDVVMCVCSERSIDSVNSKTIHLPQSERKFDLTDAVVVGIIYSV